MHHKDRSPIIFIHFGFSPYLYYTFKAARFFNPHKRIILLGDRFNKEIAEYFGMEFFNMNDYAYSNEIKEFDRLYKFISGINHGRPFWTNFVFRRWFNIHNFLQATKINSFWTFDSDNLILTDLDKQEKHFEGIDCTEQCGGICLNGFVGNAQVVDGYVKEILKIFQDEEELQKIKEEMDRNPDWAFTEMKAYEIFRDKRSVKSVRLNQPINNAVFDDCICFDDGVEHCAQKFGRNFPKKIFYNKDGLFLKCTDAEHYLRLNGINMSWVPTFVFELLLSKSIEISKGLVKHHEFKELDLFTQSSKYKVDRIKTLRWRVKNRVIFLLEGRMKD